MTGRSKRCLSISVIPAFPEILRKRCDVLYGGNFNKLPLIINIPTKIRINIKNNLLTLTSKSEEGNVKEEIIMEKTGEDLEIGFNSKYMLDALKVIDDEYVKIELNTSITPALVKPIEGNLYEYLILPVRISSN